MKDVQRKLAVARGEESADLVFQNGKIVNVLSAEIHEGDIAISGGRIAGIGEYGGENVIDLAGKYIAPAFIDGHIHLESTMLTVQEFSRAVVPMGTCAVIVDPHEYVNVLGLIGIDSVIESAKHVPLEVFVSVPSCVPATPFETSAFKIGVPEIERYINRFETVGLGEMMNYHGVYVGDETELAKIVHGRKKTVDGHAPSLMGRELNAYILAGVQSDHECTTYEEAKEKLQRGMHILIREGTTARNLHELIKLVTPANARNFSFSTDDKHPNNLQDEGHIDFHVRTAIAAGLDPIIALQIATINPARHYHLRNIGAIAPRFWANLIVFDDLNDIRPTEVYHNGILVAKNGNYLFKAESAYDYSQMMNTIHVRNFNQSHFLVPASGRNAIKVIEIIPNQIVTKATIDIPCVVDGAIVPDPERDILKVVVIERHKATGNIGIGFVRGFGLKRGAIGSTVAHDAHNIIIAGTNDRDIYFAALELVRMGGGQCVVEDGRLVQEIQLPIAGLVSDQPLDVVRRKADDLVSTTASLGCTLPDPFMTLSFLSLSPIPALKVTDLGLFDAERFQITELFA